MKALVDQGLLVRPMQKSLHESVMPWIISKMSGFLHDEDFISANVEDVVVNGWKVALNQHSTSIINEKKRREDLIFAEEQRIIKKELER